MVACSFGLIRLPTNLTHTIGDQFYDLQQLYAPLHGTFGLCLCLFGLLTNALNVCVLTRPALRTPINVLLVGVALCDAIVMLSYLGYIYHFRFIPQLCVGSHYSFFWATFVIAHSNVSLIAHTCSLYLTIILAFVRYISLKFALKPCCGLKYVTYWNAWLISGIVLIFVCVLNVPSFLSFTVVASDMSNHDCSREFGSNLSYLPPEEHAAHFSRLTPLAFQHNCFLIKAAFWITGLIFKVIPCILLLVTFVALIAQLRAFRRRRTALMQQQNHPRPPAINRSNPDTSPQFVEPEAIQSDDQTQASSASSIMAYTISVNQKRAKSMKQTPLVILNPVRIKKHHTFEFPRRCFAKATFRRSQWAAVQQDAVDIEHRISRSSTNLLNPGDASTEPPFDRSLTQKMDQEQQPGLRPTKSLPKSRATMVAEKISRVPGDILRPKPQPDIATGAFLSSTEPKQQSGPTAALASVEDLIDNSIISPARQLPNANGSEVIQLADINSNYHLTNTETNIGENPQMTVENCQNVNIDGSGTNDIFGDKAEIDSQTVRQSSSNMPKPSPVMHNFIERQETNGCVAGKSPRSHTDTPLLRCSRRGNSTNGSGCSKELDIKNTTGLKLNSCGTFGDKNESCAAELEKMPQFSERRRKLSLRTKVSNRWNPSYHSAQTRLHIFYSRPVTICDSYSEANTSSKALLSRSFNENKHDRPVGYSHKRNISCHSLRHLQLYAPNKRHTYASPVRKHHSCTSLTNSRYLYAKISSIPTSPGDVCISPRSITSLRNRLSLDPLIDHFKMLTLLKSLRFHSKQTTNPSFQPFKPMASRPNQNNVAKPAQPKISLRKLRAVKRQRSSAPVMSAPKRLISANCTIKRPGCLRIPTDRTTNMLLCVAVLFLATELPQGILSLLTAVFDGKFRVLIYNRIGDILDMLSLVNSAFNFIIYCTMNSKFRSVFNDIFVPTCVKTELTELHLKILNYRRSVNQ